MINERSYRLAAVTSHPVHYQAPLFRRLAAHPRIDLTVYYCSKHGVEESPDPGFGKAIRFDVPLLEGYEYRFLVNRSPWRFPEQGKRGLFNPGIVRELWQRCYDAVWVHDFMVPTSFLACMISWGRGIPLLFRAENHLLRPHPWWIRAARRLIYTSLFRTRGRFLAIGSLNEQFYLHYGVPQDHIFLTPYSVDNNFFQRRAEAYRARTEETKQQLGIPSHLPVVLFVGKLIDRKRPLDLLTAFEQVTADVEAALIFIGDGTQRQMLEEHVREKEIRNVYFVGFRNQTELSEFYLLGDVLVMPSVWEPWGLVVNEAMVHGLPVIATDMVGAAVDLVRHGKNGFVYPAGDVSPLSRYLREVLSDGGLRQAMGQASQEIIAGWKYDACVDGVLGALQSLSG